MKRTKKIMGKLLHTKEFYAQSVDIYKILANPIRLEILDILRKSERSVEELIKILNIRKANASQHLTILRNVKLVNLRREGVRVFYSLDSQRISKIRVLINKF